MGFRCSLPYHGYSHMTVRVQYTWASVPSPCQDVNLILFIVFANVNSSPTSDGSAAAVLASEEFVKKHGLESKAVEIVGMEMATDFKSTFNDNSAIKVVSDHQDL